MARPLLTDALRRRFAALGPQDEADDATVVVAAHFSLPGTGWDWYITAYDEDGGTPQCFCLVQGPALELGWVGLAELERLRSPRGLAVERDEMWRECSLAALRRRLAAPSRPPAGYWRRGEDWWTAEEAEDGRVPGDAAYVPWSGEETGR